MKPRRLEPVRREPPRPSRFPHLGKNLVIVLALLGAGFFAAWLRFRPYLGEEGNFSDGARTFDPSQAGAVRYAV